MLVNLNYDEKLVLDCLDKHLDHDLFDFAGVTQHIQIPRKVVYARKEDKGHILEKRSVEKYVQTIGELGNTKLRHLLINSFPIWWLTSLSEKNNRLHWGKLVFFFFEFANEFPNLFTGELIVILPQHFGHLDKFIKSNISDKVSASLSFIEPPTKNTNSLKSLVKKLVKYSGFRLNLFAKKSNSFISKNAFFTFKYSAVNENSSDFDIGWQKEEIEKTNSTKSVNLPIPTINRLSELNISNVDQVYFLRCSPSVIILLLGFVWAKLKYYFYLKNRISTISVNGVSFNKELLRKEFFFTANQIDYSLNFYWLKKFSNRLIDVNIYYSDELYKTGRLLSFFLKSRHIETYGVQHGLITKNHTVYRLSQAETEGINSVPMPKNLLIWNELFGNILGLSNKSLLRIVKYTSDAHFSRLISNVEHLRKGMQRNDQLRILWAATLWPHFTIELNIIRPIFEDSQNKITIRLHPLKRYIDKGMVVNALSGLNYSISENSYELDLAQCDLVITNSFSTVFYDAFKLKIPVFRIENYGTICDLDVQSKYVRSIYSTDELMNNIKSL